MMMNNSINNLKINTCVDREAHIVENLEERLFVHV